MKILGMTILGIYYLIIFVFLFIAFTFAFVVILIAGAFIIVGGLLKQTAEWTFYRVKETTDKIEIKITKMYDKQD